MSLVPKFSEPVSNSVLDFSRLKQLDKHSQATAQQLVQLLNKQNQLLLERQSLSEEVGHLRSQVPCMAPHPPRTHWGARGLFSLSFFKIFIFNGRIIVLQYCFGFCHSA